MFADNIAGNIYRIISHPDYNSSDETLEFLPGELVICENQKRGEELLLIAIRRNKCLPVTLAKTQLLHLSFRNILLSFSSLSAESTQVTKPQLEFSRERWWPLRQTA
jgi:hypothetical protein